jgi:hypothetical protein
LITPCRFIFCDEAIAFTPTCRQGQPASAQPASRYSTFTPTANGHDRDKTHGCEIMARIEAELRKKPDVRGQRAHIAENQV